MVDVRVGTLGELGARRPADPHRRCSSTSRRSRPRWNGTTPTTAACTPSPTTASAVPLATGRLLEHVPGVAKIGRMAVAADDARQRRRPGGARRVAATRREARGDREAVLHAQLSAAPFYERAGFAPRGPDFDEAGIAHVEMVRAL